MLIYPLEVDVYQVVVSPSMAEDRISCPYKLAGRGSIAGLDLQEEGPRSRVSASAGRTRLVSWRGVMVRLFQGHRLSSLAFAYPQADVWRACARLTHGRKAIETEGRGTAPICD
jgi:hypothetical protein